MTASTSAFADVTLGPAVAPLGAGRVSLAWRADEPTPMAVTLQAPGRPDQTVQSELVSDVHRVWVDHLAPGVEYSYRVGTRAGRFMAPPDATQDVRFGIFGDTRGGDDVHRTIVASLAELRPDFYLMTGDILIDGDPDAAWRHFFDIEQPLLSTTAFTCVRGNHDGGGTRFGNLITPQSGSDNRDRSYGSMSLGPVHFLLVDTEQAVGAGSPQRTFVEQDLAAHQNEPLVVMLHKPLFSTGVHGGDGTIRDALAPVFQRYGVDLVFQGHDHLYERSSPINGVTYVVTGGGGAGLYNAGVETWTQVMEKVHHYVVVEASATRIHVVVKRHDGSQLDTFDVDPAANNGGRYADATSLPSGGGGCTMVVFGGGNYRRAGGATAALGTLGPMAVGLVSVRGRRRRRR